MNKIGKHLNAQEFNELINQENSIVVDMSEVFKTKQIEKLYIDDFYGGHLSNYANKLVSSTLFSVKR